MSLPAQAVAGVEPLDQRRISVVCRTNRVDVSLPAHLELVAIIPELVDLVRDHIRSVIGPGTLVDLDAEMGATGPGSWQLTRLNGDPLTVSESLARQQVTDGEILVLDRRLVPSPAPLIDDVLEGVASTGGASAEWTDRDTARAAHVVIWTLGGVLSLAFFVSMVGSSGPMPALLAGGLSATSLVALALGRILSLPAPTVLTSGAGTAWFAGLAAAAATTGPAAPEHVLAGCTVVAVIAGILFATTESASATAVAERSLYLGVSVVGWAGAIAAGAVWWFGVPLHAVGAAATLVGTAGLTLAPSLSVSLGGIQLPSVPGPTDEQPDDDLGIEHSPDALPDPRELAARGRSARGMLGALLAGFGAVVVVGALLALTGVTSAPLLSSTLAVVLVGVLLLRGTTTADRAHTTIQFVCAFVLVVGMLLGATLAARDPLGSVALGSFAVMAATVIASLVLPRLELSPLARGALGVLESILVAAVVPLALGVMEVYQFVRQL